MADGATSIKIVFLGDSGVGKTSIVTRYVTGTAPAAHSPTVETIEEYVMFDCPSSLGIQ